MEDRMVIGVVLPEGYTSGSDFAKDCNVEVLGHCTEGLFKTLKKPTAERIERAEAIGAVIARLKMIVDLEPGSRGAYQKFEAAKQHARDALESFRAADFDTSI